MTNNGQTLIIPNFDESDNGQYICVASDGQQFANHRFNVHLTAGPSTTATHLPVTHKTTHSHHTTTPRGE
jgi:hypothetical protein